ncbi:MAG: hypothetical protein PUJ51_00195 [Clostridiales bacterium]|uniref:hypothetical protein n=1 Tax=Terrisporobacter sp. TaxID=1965305 RepID=UPI002A500449|nr:hypothetical protein [Terrisporobacter sp.]MDD7752924.1 hypothetical protein [Clostridiales bacterium]MDY4133697.1 hypothetical protein [Terrisporobacter sp.]
MTKTELIKMIESIGDNEELRFIEETKDRDGFPEETVRRIFKVVGESAKLVRKECGIYRYE